MEEDEVKITVRETSIGDYCGHCGRYLDENYQYCPDCNEKLYWAKEE